MSDINFNTHQELFEIIFHYIITHTDLGDWCATADLPGYRWGDRNRTGDASAKGQHALNKHAVGLSSSSSDEEQDIPVKWRARSPPEVPVDGEQPTSESSEDGAPLRWEQLGGEFELGEVHSTGSESESDPDYCPPHPEEDSTSANPQNTQTLTPPAKRSARATSQRRARRNASDHTQAAPARQKQKQQRNTMLTYLDTELGPAATTATTPALTPAPRALAAESAQQAASSPSSSDNGSEASDRARYRQAKLFSQAGILAMRSESEKGESSDSSTPEEIEPFDRQKIRTLRRKGGCTPSGLPWWAGVGTHKSRPDAIIIEGVTHRRRRLKPSPAEKSHIVFHLFEFTRTSEAYLKQSRKKKKEQHRELTTAAHAERNGSGNFT